MDADDVDRAVEIARRATAHNSGDTILDVHRVQSESSLFDNDDIVRVDLTMSSWPRAEEAVNALRRDGFHAYHTGDRTVTVTQ